MPSYQEPVEIELDTVDIFSDGVVSSVSFQLSANTSSALVTLAETTVQFPMVGKTELIVYG